MRKRSRDHEKMEDLVRGEEVVERPRREPLRDAVRAVPRNGGSRRVFGMAASMCGTGARPVQKSRASLVRSHRDARSARTNPSHEAEMDILQQCPSDVAHSREQKPPEPHLVAQRVEAVGYEPMQGRDDAAQAEKDEHFRARTAMRRLTVFRV